MVGEASRQKDRDPGRDGQHHSQDRAASPTVAGRAWTGSGPGRGSGELVLQAPAPSLEGGSFIHHQSAHSHLPFNPPAAVDFQAAGHLEGAFHPPGDHQAAG
jgi:hypothetical protein